MDRQSEFTFNFAGAAVIMIDASAMSMEVMTSILSGYGFKRMFRCSTLSAGLDVLKSHRVDLVLIDPECFGEEGYSAIRWLRSETNNPNCETSVLITTVLPHVRAVTASRQCGADYVVAKPFSTTTLLERILWVATGDGRRGDLSAPPTLVNQAGSGVDLW